MTSFKPALNSKGLRHFTASVKLRCACFKPALNSKGLRRVRSVLCNGGGRFKPALNSKGLRPNVVETDASTRFKPALNSKGLRPLDGGVTVVGIRLQASPEFKGIKTCSAHCNQNSRVGFKPALNSKGLRLARGPMLRSIGFKPALNSKGLRHGTQPQDRRHHWPDRFDCLPDQHPGAERGRGSRPRG